MKKLFFYLGLFFLFLVNLRAQNQNLFPQATWLQDVHWAGTVYAGIGVPLMVDVQAHAGSQGELTFYLKSDVELAKPFIEEIHAQGRQYWLNLDATRLEGVTSQDIVDDDQGITDPYFGCKVSLEGNVSVDVKSITRPAWRNYVISCIKRAIEAGADGSQHDGGWPPYDSFDEDDLNAFKQYVIDQGINTYDWDYNAMSFAEYLISKGKNDDNVFNTDNDPASVKELLDDWKTFKAIRTLQAWQAIKDSCQAFAESLGREYTLAINAASKFGTRDGNAYWAADYYIGEFFNWGNYFPLTGSVTARAKMAEAFGKRFICWSSPTLEDIDDGDPNTGYGIDIDSQAEMALAAQLYASGGLPQLKYPADRTYPVFYLAQNNSDLLNAVQPFGETAVLMSQAQMIQDTRGIEGLIVALQDINRSLKVVWLASNLLNKLDNFSLNDINHFKAVFLPEVFYLTDNQKNVLLNYMQNGGTIVAVRGNVEYCGQYDEHGNENTVPEWEAIANQTNSGVFYYGNGRYINIAHNILESNGYPPYLYGLAYLNYKADPEENQIAVAIRDTIQKWMDVAIPCREVVSSALPNYVRFFRYQDSTAHRYVYQVLADSVNLASRQPVPVNAFQVELAVSAYSLSRSFTATWYSIDQPEGLEIGSQLVADPNTGRVTVTIPSFSRWGFVHLDGSAEAANSVEIGHLAINGVTQFRRLKSHSAVTGSWDVISGTPDLFEVEVWTNIRNAGSPVVSSSSENKNSKSDPLHFKALEAGFLKGVTHFDNLKIASTTFPLEPGYLKGATRLLNAQINAITTEYTVPDSALHDSVVYLFRVRAIQGTDTSHWIHQFFYRNAKPGAPHESQIFTAHQNLWYYTDNASSPADTSYRPIIAFNKAPHYGGDFELDSLLFGVYIYTDSLTGGKGDTSSTLHLIGTQFKHKLAWNESMPDARGDVQDTIFSLKDYENFGIYFRAVATDLIDTSDFSPWFWFYLDNHNDPPNPFHLIAPLNNSVLPKEVPFSWTNGGDPDPFNKQNYTISKIEIMFDSIPSFNSPGLRLYAKERSGLEFEKDTITVNLPSNFFQAEKLDTYDKVYWKVRMYDFDWHSADGSNVLYTESTESYTFSIGNPPSGLQAPALKTPPDHAFDLPLQVRLEWEAVPGATKYILQVARDAQFTQLLMDNPDVVQPNFDLKDLEPQTTYYWRIKSRNENEQSDWSVVWKFSTMATPEPVILLTPTPNCVISTDTVHFVWHAGFPLAERYAFEYATEPGFTQAFVDSSVQDTVYFLTGLEAGRTYYWRVKAFNQAGWGLFSEARDFTIELMDIDDQLPPKAYNLLQNYPNPFNPSTHISFWLPTKDKVKIELFNAYGQKLKTLFYGEKAAGRYELTINLSNLPSGIYFYKMRTSKFQKTRKLILLK